MKTKRIISILLCIFVIVLLFVLGSGREYYSSLSSTEELGRTLGIYSVLPTIFAVALAFLLGDVVVALVAGLICGEVMIAVTSGCGFAGAMKTIIPGTVQEMVSTASDRGNAQVLILCALVGGMVGVLRLSGGFESAADKLSKKINTPRKANLVSQLFCMFFFFDDYANALISGPVLQPVTDNAGVSRERLSYIVDSTAAPVAGIAVVSSWVAVEISVISEGLEVAGIEQNAFELFLHSVPFCFYCLFAILFILLTTLTGREYGPMLKAERRARNGQAGKGVVNTAGADKNKAAQKSKSGIVTAFSCIAFLIVYSVVSLVVLGGDTIEILLQATFICGLAAVVLGSVTKLYSMRDAVGAYLEGASSLMPTIIVLILAWSLASVIEKLGTVYYVVELITTSVPWQLVPALIFVSCCVVSFAAGSYGCMFMVMPMAIPTAVAVISAPGLNIDGSFLLLCIASVLSGGIFGDHCSPMTDCTILAALGSGCETMDHVVTQMPYALTVAAVAVVCILLSTVGVSPYISIAVGTAAMASVIYFFGKKPERII